MLIIKCSHQENIILNKYIKLIKKLIIKIDFNTKHNPHPNVKTLKSVKRGEVSGGLLPGWINVPVSTFYCNYQV